MVTGSEKIKLLISYVIWQLIDEDTNKIQENCREFLKIGYTPLSVNYAMMANSNPQFLKIIKQAGLKIFVNSSMIG